MINFAIKWCKLCGFDVQFCDKGDGLTDVSLAIFKQYRDRIGAVVGVYLIYPPENEPWGFWTVLVNRDSEAFIFSGFSWGYLGSGSHGLCDVLQAIGWEPLYPVPIPCHVPGVWSLDSFGHICKMPDITL